jgi:NADH-quinone oxidoreductase subunit L
LLFGAVIGCAKDDIKKARRVHHVPDRLHGAGGRSRPAGYAIAIMHLLTHGFFKAGSSSVPAR